MRLIFIVFLSAYPTLLYAGKGNSPPKSECEDNLRESRSGVDILEGVPTSLDLPLSQVAIDRLKRHSIFQLRSKWEQGKNVSFQLALYPPTKEMFLIFRGETIQGVFIAKILSEIFPQAEFVARANRKPKHKKAILLSVHDYAEEDLEDEPLTDPNIIPMEMCKSANVTTSAIDRVDIRKRFGFGKKFKVISVYLREYGASIETMRLLKYIQMKLKPQVVFVSTNLSDATQNRKPKYLSEARKFARGIYAHTLLSDYSPEDLLELDRPLLIFNDVTGYLPHLHAASDLAIIAGPVNMFESINVGTPTIILRIETDGYDLAGFERLIKTAERTGGAKAIDQIEELEQAASDLAGKTPTPSYLVEENGKTPFDELLDRLQEVIQSQ
jgi:hypothetical protein